MFTIFERKDSFGGATSQSAKWLATFSNNKLRFYLRMMFSGSDAGSRAQLLVLITNTVTKFTAEQERLPLRSGPVVYKISSITDQYSLWTFDAALTDVICNELRNFGRPRYTSHVAHSIAPDGLEDGCALNQPWASLTAQETSVPPCKPSIPVPPRRAPRPEGMPCAAEQDGTGETRPYPDGPDANLE